MANILNFRTGVRLSPDGKWIACSQCSKAYWGAFRPTDFVNGKLAAHVAKAHKAVEVEADASAAQLPAAPAPAKPARPAPRARNAKLAAKAKAKGDGEVQQVRLNTADMAVLEAHVQDALRDIGLELDPRLQLAQGPRFFPGEGGARAVKDRNKGQDVVARVQDGLSPLLGWA